MVKKRLEVELDVEHEIFADIEKEWVYFPKIKYLVRKDKRKMNELIKITQNENNEQVVSGRDLHDFLGVETQYTKWFDRMTEYGFVENSDYVEVSQKCLTSHGRPYIQTDHALKLDMAKEISMIQRNEKGKQARQYFIEAEKQAKLQQLRVPTTQRELAKLALAANEETNQRLDGLENTIEDLKDRFGLPSSKAKVLQKKIATKVYIVLGGKESNAYRKMSRKVFREFYKGLNNWFDVAKYSDIPLSRYDEALEYATRWQPSTNTSLEIGALNSQMSLEV